MTTTTTNFDHTVGDIRITRTSGKKYITSLSNRVERNHWADAYLVLGRNDLIDLRSVIDDCLQQWPYGGA